MVKAVLFDLDGVVLLPRDKYFSDRLKADGFEVDEESVKTFFNTEYKDIVVGKGDLKESLKKYLPKWGWKGSVDDLLIYWFSHENNVSLESLQLAQDLRKKGVKCYIASDHSSYRADYLMKEMRMEKLFDGSFFSHEVGHTKNQPEYFDYVISHLGFSPEDILFIDDDEENIIVANMKGLKTIHYTKTPNIYSLL